jgi:nucleoside-diphosphate-sugar epimerase
MNSNIVILGSQGFVGQSLVNFLLKQNFDVTAISRDSCKHLGNPNVYGSMNVEVNLDQHLQALENFTLINCIRSNNIQDNVAALTLIEKIGKLAKTNINFSSYIQYYENRNNSVLNEYRRSQSDQSSLLQSLNSKFNSNFINLALFTIYGPGDSPISFMSSTIRGILQKDDLNFTKLEQLVSYTWIEDLIAITHRILINSESYSGEYSFWPEPPIKLKEVVNLMLQIYGSSSRAHIGVIPYKGHEIFSYDVNGFPRQIDPSFNWTKIDFGLDRLRKINKENV